MSDEDRALPSREVSYAYCVAMYFAQQIEDNLRYILDSAEYYGEIDEIELTAREKKKYPGTAEMLESANYGRLLHALKERINLPSSAHWNVLRSALRDRNFLAHTFLVEFDYDHLIAKKEKDIVTVLGRMSLRMWDALQITRALRRSLDAKTKDIDKHLADLLRELGVENIPLEKGRLKKRKS